MHSQSLSSVVDRASGSGSLLTHPSAFDTQDAGGWVMVTPELALKWLARNHTNRHLSSGLVAFYSKQMSNGEWRPNPQPIMIDSDGELLDGQHRLQAVVESEIATWFWVIENCPQSIRDVVDTGKSRTPGDLLSMVHEDLGSFGTECSAATRTLILWDRRPSSPFGAAGATFPGGKVSNAQILLEFNNRKELIVEAVHRWKVLSRAGFTGGSSFWGALLVKFALIDEAATDEFVGLLASGANLDREHPVLLLHNRLLEMSHSRYQMKSKNDVAALVIRAWNAWRQGRTMGKLVGMRLMDRFPEPV
jgi:hypothetical protein